MKERPPPHSFRSIVEAAASRREDQTDLGSPEGRVDALHALLEAGFDPNAMDDLGNTALGIVGNLTRGSQEELIGIGKRILEIGGNPLRGDKPLGDTIQHAYSSLLLNAIVMGLNRHETEGHGLRDDKDGTVLHYLCEHQLEMTAEYVEEDAYADSPQDRYFDTQLFLAKNDQGDTVLHALWQVPSEYDSGWQNLEPLQSKRWVITAAAMDAGLDVIACNQDGAMVAELIENAVNHGTAKPDDATWEKIEAALASHRLEGTTPSVGGTRSGPRL